MAGTARQHFSDELQRVEDQALGGLDLVVGQLDRVLEALQHQDVELAAMTIANDDLIDGRYLEVHQGILALLALQAPVAGDLRIVAALLHVMKNIERMGDQCVNIAKIVPLAGHEPPADERILSDIGQMATRRASRSSSASRPSSAATSRSPRTWSARTIRSTVSTGTCSAWRWRSGTTPTRANGRCT